MIIDEKKFHEGLMDLSNKTTSSSDGGNTQEQVLDLTEALEELSGIQDNQEKL